MARSTFAKYAERFSIGVIALVIVAWAVLTFFADDSQESDAVGPDQVDQTDDAVEPGAGPEPGVGVSEDDEEPETVAGDDTDSDRSDGATESAEYP